MAGDGVKQFLKSKPARILLLCFAALLLLFGVWKVFFGVENASSAYRPTEQEVRLCRILEGVEGIGKATAMIAEEDGVPVRAVVIFEGADSILTRMRVLDITASALGIDKKKIQIYPSGQAGN